MTSPGLSCESRDRCMTSGGESAWSLKSWITILDRAEKILVPGQGQVRIVATLQKQLHAADIDRLVDFREDLIEAEHVTLARTHVAVERTEIALRHAHVRVVHVPIDDVGGDPLGMLAPPDEIGKAAEHMGGRILIEGERFVRD